MSKLSLCILTVKLSVNIYPENKKPFKELIGESIWVNLVNHATNKGSGSHMAKILHTKESVKYQKELTNHL